MTRTVVHKDPVCSFNTPWLSPIIDQYLRFEPWDPEKTYDPGTLFYINCLEFGTAHAQQFCLQRIDQGFRIIVDNLWEVNPGATMPGAQRICCDRWFWYNESLWYRYQGLDQYQPCADYQYRALMPMNRRREHRDNWLAQIRTDDLMWSYVEMGRELPGNCDMSLWDAQRYMNPSWYDQCYMSMVVESFVRAGSKYTPTFITEKTFKPIAFEHPFLIYGNCGTLRRLHEWGFETWDNLWDESYDQITDTDSRRDAVAQLINSMEIIPHSTETLRRLQHNRDLFFNYDFVKQSLIAEIIEPIIEYAEQ